MHWCHISYKIKSYIFTTIFHSPFITINKLFILTVWLSADTSRSTIRVLRLTVVLLSAGKLAMVSSLGSWPLLGRTLADWHCRNFWSDIVWSWLLPDRRLPLRPFFTENNKKSYNMPCNTTESWLYPLQKLWGPPLEYMLMCLMYQWETIKFIWWQLSSFVK